MHKFFVVGVISFALFVAIPLVAQADFLLGMAVGSAMSSGDDDQATGNGGGDVLYTAPRIAERISNPLEIRIIASKSQCFSSKGDFSYGGNCGGMAIQEIFNHVIEGKESQYIILQVKRVVGTNNQWCVLWFTYIEKDKIIPLEKLSSIERKK